MYDDYYVGSFDISKYTTKYKTNSNDVILTPERKEHIRNRHPEVIPYLCKIEEILSSPDEVYEELTHEDTLWLIKGYDNRIKITVKLNTYNSINEKYKNSIIQMQIIKRCKISKYVENKKIVVRVKKFRKV